MALRRVAPAPREGELFTNAALARALQLIADEGCGSFYNGIIAEELAAYLNQTGSALTAEDLAVHRGEWIEAPASVTYRERYTVYELPPNVQGIAALSMLNMLELVNVSALGHNSADLLHLSVEIKKLNDLNAQPRRSNTNEARNPGLVNEQGVNFRPLR